MWERPNTVVITTGHAEGKYKLSAFDNALIDAGIGHLNLIKVSSILPPAPRLLNIKDIIVQKIIKPASFIPCVLSSLINKSPGIKICSSIGIALPQNDSDYGLIFEHSGVLEKLECEQIVKDMLLNAASIRDISFKTINVYSETHVVNKIGCTIAVALLLKV